MDTSNDNGRKKPNIIMVLIDAQRARDLSLYGYEKETDPEIKKIASESIVFDNAFSTSGASDVALTSIFSGQYPTTSGFLHQTPRTEKIELERLRKNKFWFPIYLQKIGYKTISITPQFMWFKKGFDYCKPKEPLGASKYLISPPIKKLMLSLPSWLYSFGKKMTKVRASPIFVPAKDIITSTINRINETEQPFFMHVHLLDVHCPYGSVEVKRINGETTIRKVLEKVENKTQKEYIKKRFSDMGTNSMEQTIQKLDDSIRFVDEQIGRLVSYLKKENLWDNTILIIMADHGENFGEHGNYFCRGGLYDSSIHIPLIMHLPGLNARRINSMVSNIDVPATILDYLGEEKKEIDGKSLIPLIKGELEDDGSFRDKIISVDGFCKDRFAVRTKNKKLIISDNGNCYLCGMKHDKEKFEEYDLEKDPEELNNIYEGDSELQGYLESEMDKVKPDLKESVTSEVISVN